MARIIAVANQKGGVGKTTTCVNLCAALADMNYRTLLVDLDPQGNATVGCGIAPRELERSAFDVMTGERTVAEVSVRLEDLGFDLLPSNSDLTAAEVVLLQREEREFQLRRALQPVSAQYGWIIIDCPPSLNMLTLNALTAANSVLIPIQCEYYALEGLAALLDTIEQVRASVNPGLQIEGLLRTMFDIRNNLSSAVSDQLTEHFGEHVYRTLVPRNVRVAEAPSHGLPVLRYDPASRGALAYLGLAAEVLRRSRQRAAG
ncbi:MAG: AAA family ATPase [Xanthomonadales bacterium]|nr:AAA family ATPase [Xanthomonadales bacterium]NIN60573.1 AAA family ATPase [Xanthomonadales bacterium]NIN75925.1 AAA family ATPase [Xanthomonadales bacterium]NIO15017.1 AAA family ATPase [Xanthomonadales bacterium]NIP12966.1 AAA family ATPase [Xanthomonadales bacterium]